MTQPNDLIDLGIDAETYYDGEYSLHKMQTAQYVMDPRFEIIGLSYKLGDDPVKWITGTLEEIHAALVDLPWERIRVVAHNARFEGAILEWRLGFKPAAYLCTLVGSRPHFVPFAGGASLDAITKYLGVGVKGTYVQNARGMRRNDFTIAQLAEYSAYCCNDTELGLSVADAIRGVLPPAELELIDATIRKYVRPRLCLDKAALVGRLQEIENEKAARLVELRSKYGVGIEEIRSRKRFALVLGPILAKSGSSLPSKISRTTGALTHAFAKDDVGFKVLLGHESEAVRDLVSAKLFFASSLEESRIRRLIEMHDILGGRLAVPLVYYGAHTGRFSGDESINLQNLPRVEYADKAKRVLKKGHLRFAITAPAGYSIVTADLSNIEARIVATLSGQTDLVEGFRRGEDIYARFAAQIYGTPVHKDTHPGERFIGKTCILGLGFGMGWKKFHLKMIQEGIIMSPEEAKRIVYLYRNTYAKIPGLWRDFDYAARKFMTDRQAMYPWRGLIFAHERIILPNGMPILYPGIRFTNSGGIGFRSRFAKESMADTAADGISAPAAHLNNVWGGAFTENVAQALARIILTRAELKLAKMGIVSVLNVHDELVWIIPTILVSRVKKVIAEVMTEQVDFLPDLPVAVEIHDGFTYGSAK